MQAAQAPKRALFIGRFQPFHKGHLHAVKTILKKYEELIILIGSAETRDPENPFTAGQRIEMIHASLPSNLRGRILLIPVRDVNNHSSWVEHCLGYLPTFHTVFTNNRLVLSLFEEKGFYVSETPEKNRPFYQGAFIRSRIKEGKKWDLLVPKGCVPFIERYLQKRC